ncbi:hypothetical protein RJ640_030518 [Escallonia rubra]|uniref:Protein kinase domain-containing protein n=1 Tax=Escallonia rubra TaxID=112253 RepID=A0AA88QFZ8_9ASTE|nr:hypothetical protein RJ640_030518 [Escallonia rubra]
MKSTSSLLQSTMKSCIFRSLHNKITPSNSMDELHSSKILLTLYLLILLFRLSSLPFLSSAYTPPEQYFINCGSASSTSINGRNFIGDISSRSFSLTGQSNPVKDTNLSSSTSPLYQTARIFTRPSWYELQIAENGTYLVRLHFYLFSSSNNLSDAQFNVSASGFSLLSNFTPQKSDNSPVIQEFLISISVGKFRIYFTPSQETRTFAFVNAVEVFLAPDGFVPDSATRVSPSGRKSDYNDLKSHALRTIYRINVGGVKLTQDNDTLWRNWVPDDEYLYLRDAAKNSEFYGTKPKYQDGGATEYFAPDPVYQTAKQLNIDSARVNNFFNVTWRFNVSKNATHLVIGPALEDLKFNLYIYSEFGLLIDPRGYYPQQGAPFYYDFVVDTDNSGVMNVSIGPREDSVSQTAFLNGLEIMELMTNLSTGPEKRERKKKEVPIIIGSVVGGVAFVFVVLMAFLIRLRYKKTKSVATLDWPLVPSNDGSPYSGITERNTNASSYANLNLGLKVPFAEIVYATNDFDAKLMIGEGGFGKVYKGTLPSGVKVAVKRSEPGHGQGLAEFQTEIIILSKIRHRHLVSLIGYCDERSEMILVYEYMEKGTLREHLYSWKGGSKGSSSKPELSWNRRLEICIGAAKGLHYLHTCSDGGIIHRDVKSTNILLDEHYVAKVADFGLSRSGPPDQSHVSTDVKGSFGYLDPEYFRCLQLTQKSDVYSFGVVLLEVLCARPALNNVLPREQVNLADWGIVWQKKGQLEKVVDPFIVDDICTNSLRKFGETAEKCLKEDGVDRPTMLDVVWDLEYALQLQQTIKLREPHEDSTTDVSWELPLPVFQRLPSHSIPIHKDEMPLSTDDGLATSYTSASDVFSQLRIDDAR